MAATAKGGAGERWTVCVSSRAGLDEVREMEKIL
jgi:hypothetical protein